MEFPSHFSVEIRLHKISHVDHALNRLRDERDHLAILLSLAADAEARDWSRVDALERKLKAVERSITAYRPAEASGPGQGPEGLGK